MHDNSVTEIRRISEQIKRRRAELGLSLSEVARRAGTSAATLSRYENGWTRFETYTLRKLAAALECELTVALKPRRKVHQSAPTVAQACAQLKRLFWDHTLSPDDIRKHRVWVMERVLEYGTLHDLHALRAVMSHEVFLATVAAASRVSPRTRNFWRQILEMEGRSCTRKSSRNTAWNS
jgi:transcriptional regulator with XRE-family HTH domain